MKRCNRCRKWNENNAETCERCGFEYEIKQDEG